MSVRFDRTGSTAGINHNDLMNRGTRTHAEIDVHLGEIDAARKDSVDLNARLEYLGSKVIVFVIPFVDIIGPQPVEIMFPFSGVISDVSTSCAVTSSTGPIKIQIERCSKAAYDSSPVWSGVLSTYAQIDPSEKSSSTSIPVIINNAAVAANDYFRVNVLAAPANIEGLTVQVKVKI